MVEIEICDNGPGIPEDMMESLFEKFVTKDQSRKAQHTWNRPRSFHM